MLQKPFSRLNHPLDVVRHFTPNWFAVTMGTGILALCLNKFPYHSTFLHSFAMGLWLLNIGLFALFSALFIGRILIFPSITLKLLKHPVQSMFLGCIPMGLVTIINGLLVFGTQLWGDAIIPIASCLWWVDSIMSVTCSLLVPYFMFTRQEHSMPSMTTVWLLPIVASEVAAASGGFLVPYLTGQSAVVVWIVSYVLWAISVPLAFGILIIFFQRLVLHKLPCENMAASIWLCLGPIGTAALGLLLLGSASQKLVQQGVFATSDLVIMGQVAEGFGLIVATMFWGFGLWWLAMAMLVTVHYLCKGMPFNMGWWAFTFPLGVYTAATLTLAQQTNIVFFYAFGATFVILLFVFWAIVAARTLHGGYHGHLIQAPCLVECHPEVAS
ncbi:C4-dicarboxylate ABC transporter [Desulfolithobacter dissulfuricans]|uniref:C4-dicarboxylate ABC transporter n=1 Tax=Desulfolithobacter dissulfuricans TaxID=2795293 RepID=A0A915TXX5_9BACT|nr:TDT family transporter [Desulfolithobacter dissulfuricans]BCO08033.1 C4-dicarboxylate ABC transporter [Desulfolithobacter dissulfuricans]